MTNFKLLLIALPLLILSSCNQDENAIEESSRSSQNLTGHIDAVDPLPYGVYTGVFNNVPTSLDDSADGPVKTEVEMGDLQVGTPFDDIDALSGLDPQDNDPVDNQDSGVDPIKNEYEFDDIVTVPDHGDPVDPQDYDDLDTMDHSEDFKSCDVFIGGTGSGEKLDKKFNVIVGNKEKLLSELERLSLENKAFFNDSLAGNIPYEANSIIKENRRHVDTELAFSDSGQISLTSFNANKALFFAKNSLDLKVTELKADTVIVWGKDKVSLLATDLDAQKVIVLVERSKSSLKVCSNFTGLDADLNIDVDALQGDQTYVYAQATRWDSMNFSSSINGGLSAKHVLLGTSFKNMDLSINNGSLKDNSTKIKFTSFKYSNASFNFLGQSGDFLVEGTSINDSIIEIVNNSSIGTTASNKIAHSDDQFENLNMLGAGEKRIILSEQSSGPPPKK